MLSSQKSWCGVLSRPLSPCGGGPGWADEKVFSRHCCCPPVSVANFLMPRILGPSPQPSPKGRGSQFGLIAKPRARRHWFRGTLTPALSQGEREPVWPDREAFRARRHWFRGTLTPALSQGEREPVWPDREAFRARRTGSAGPSPQPSPKGRGSQFGLIAQPGATRYWLPLPLGEGWVRGSQFGLIAQPGALPVLAPSPLGRGLG